MITDQDVLSIGILRRTHYRDLPPFIFVKRDGLLVPFRAEQAGELMGEEAFVLRSDVAEDEEGTLTWQDLVGYTILDEKADGEKEKLGEIASIDESTLNTLATLTDGRLLPLHEDFILDIDTDARLIHVNLPFAL